MRASSGLLAGHPSTRLELPRNLQCGGVIRESGAGLTRCDAREHRPPPAASICLQTSHYQFRRSNPVRPTRSISPSDYGMLKKATHFPDMGSPFGSGYR
jgi:hypothetical protein